MWNLTVKRKKIIKIRQTFSSTKRKHVFWIKSNNWQTTGPRNLRLFALPEFFGFLLICNFALVWELLKTGLSLRIDHKSILFVTKYSECNFCFRTWSTKFWAWLFLSTWSRFLSTNSNENCFWSKKIKQNFTSHAGNWVS